jgi:hypothetical protein
VFLVLAAVISVGELAKVMLTFGYLTFVKITGEEKSQGDD